MTQSKLSKEFYIPIVKAGITLLLLWGIGAILKDLPMIEELYIEKLPLSAPTIVEMVITSLMVVVLVNFARDFGRQLRRVLPRFPQSSIILVSLVYIIAIVIVYNAFSPLGRILFKDSFWIYQVGFLALVLLPLWIGGATLYKNTDKLVDLITTEVDKAAEEMTQMGRYVKEVTCSNCGALNVPEAKFCFQCGAGLTAPAADVTASCACPACGVENDADASFCIECGAVLSPSQD